jgi:r1t holin
MFTVAFWKDAAIRAIRTGAQVLLVALGADGAGIVGLDFGSTAALVGGSMVASILNSVVIPQEDQKAKKDDVSGGL